MLEEHHEVTEVSSQNRLQQRFLEQSVGRERISESRVEQVVDVSTWQMVEVSQHRGETVGTDECRKFFERHTDGDECQAAFNV